MSRLHDDDGGDDDNGCDDDDDDADEGNSNDDANKVGDGEFAPPSCVASELACCVPYSNTSNETRA